MYSVGYNGWKTEPPSTGIPQPSGQPGLWATIQYGISTVGNVVLQKKRYEVAGTNGDPYQVITQNSVNPWLIGLIAIVMLVLVVVLVKK